MFRAFNRMINPTLFRYSVAVMDALAAMGLYRLVEWSTGQPFPTYLFFNIAVIITGVMFGLGPALTTTFTSAGLVLYFIMEPAGTPFLSNVVDAIGLVTFLGLGILISILAETYRTTRRELHESKGIASEYKRYDPIKKFKVYGGFFAAVVILATTILVSHQSTLAWVQWNEKEAYADKVIIHLDNLNDAISDMEAKQRFYIITGYKKDVEAYNKDYALVQDRLNSIDQLAQKDPELQRSLVPVFDTIVDKIEFMNKVVELRQQAKGIQTAHDLIVTERGVKLMTDLEKLFASIKDRELKLKLEYSAKKQKEFSTGVAIMLGGSILGILLFISIFMFLRIEINRRLDAEAELTRLNEELKLEIEKHLHSERSLQKRTGELYEINKELELFAYVTSHDLKQPVRMIVSFMQLFEKKYKDKIDAEGQKYIQFVVDGAKQMGQLIDALLDYSHINRSSIRSFELTEMTKPLGIAMDNLKMDIEESKAEITHDELPVVKVDPTMIVQLFQNLIANAIKFTGDKAPKIHIRAYKDNNSWVFCVKDNGIGISKLFFEKIFTVFFKLHIKEEDKGSGIGLAICKKIVEYHNGRIWVESKEGQGATFYFSIPA